jgi:hypothetical protein
LEDDRWSAHFCLAFLSVTTCSRSIPLPQVFRRRLSL